MLALPGQLADALGSCALARRPVALGIMADWPTPWGLAGPWNRGTSAPMLALPASLPTPINALSAAKKAETAARYKEGHKNRPSCPARYV